MKYLIIVLLSLVNTVVAAQATNKMSVSIVTDWKTVTAFGSPSATLTAINDRMKMVADIYRTQLDIELDYSFVDIPYAANEDITPTDTQPYFLLTSFKNLRADTSKPIYAEHRKRGATILLSTRNLTQHLVGISVINSACDAGAVAIAELSSNTTDVTTDANLIAHELAHVLGAEHDGEYATATNGLTRDSVCAHVQPPPSYLMAPTGATTINQFSQCSIDTVKTFYPQHQCIVQVKQPLPATSVKPKSSGGGGSFGIIGLIILSMLGFARNKVRY